MRCPKEVKARARADKRRWLNDSAEESDTAARHNRSGDLYQLTRKIAGKGRNMTTIKDKEGKRIRIFFYFLLLNNSQFGGTTCKFAATIARSITHTLETFYCRGALGTRVNPDTIECVWTGEVDLNTLLVDGEMFESGKKKLRIQKYPNTCGQSLNLCLVTFFFTVAVVFCVRA